MPSHHRIQRLWQKHVLAVRRRDVTGLLATLSAHPSVVFKTTGQIWEGREQVMWFYQSLFAAVPDAVFEPVNHYVGATGVVDESRLTGRRSDQDAPGLPPPGSRLAPPLIAVYPLQGERFQGMRLYCNPLALRGRAA